MLAVGASGVVSVASHVVGQQIKEMIELFQSGQVAQSRHIHLQLLPLFKDLFVETNPAPVKAALQLLGWQVGSVRLPLVPLSSSAHIQLQSTLEQLGLLSVPTEATPQYV